MMCAKAMTGARHGLTIGSPFFEFVAQVRARVLKVYRHHRPRLEFFPAAKDILKRYRCSRPLYLVTDGHNIVRRNKVDALDLWGTFQRVLITHRFGRAAAKPSTLCFERILAAEKGAWSDLVYVGDNPAKDFVSLNARGRSRCAC
jgi:putative hydrolase of the HAD superfamily